MYGVVSSSTCQQRGFHFHVLCGMVFYMECWHGTWMLCSGETMAYLGDGELLCQCECVCVCVCVCVC